jgi:hypothetical protein
MATKAGVWIDHKQAIVVLITNAGPETKKFKSGIEQPVRPFGSARPQHKYTPNDFIAEDSRERKLESGRKKVYDDVLACLRGADSLLILGPGEAKGEFGKYLAKKRRGLTVEVKTADKMTDRQIAAQVSEYFAATSDGKATTPKKTAKTTPGKRSKKTGK